MRGVGVPRVRGHPAVQLVGLGGQLLGPGGVPAQPGQPAGLPQHVRAHLRPAQRDRQPPRLGVVGLEAGEVGEVQPDRRPGAAGPRTPSSGAGPCPTMASDSSAAASRSSAAPGRPQTARQKLFSARPSSSGSPIRRAISMARRAARTPRSSGLKASSTPRVPSSWAVVAVVGARSAQQRPRAGPPCRRPPRRAAASSTAVTLPQTAAACGQALPVVQLAGHGDRLGRPPRGPRCASRCAAGRCRAR